MKEHEKSRISSWRVTIVYQMSRAVKLIKTAVCSDVTCKNIVENWNIIEIHKKIIE